ncbi:UNVERIFIED_CONTAM: hypothetical protein Sradi_3380200 [Sesamum radiatum]|uniref:Uncharacterized protein n=1 Tax=Sesamum radiatum TaxID=300843 RepID=A0AAW2R3H7_SESRA
MVDMKQFLPVVSQNPLKGLVLHKCTKASHTCTLKSQEKEIFRQLQVHHPSSSYGEFCN